MHTISFLFLEAEKSTVSCCELLSHIRRIAGACKPLKPVAFDHPPAAFLFAVGTIPEARELRLYRDIRTAPFASGRGLADAPAKPRHAPPLRKTRCPVHGSLCLARAKPSPRALATRRPVSRKSPVDNSPAGAPPDDRRPSTLPWE